jgi:hypothetical protein
MEMDFASTIAGVTVSLLHLLRLQEFGQHSLITCLTHRQREFFTVQTDYFSAPTTLNHQTVGLHELLVLSQSVFNH